MAVGLYQKTTSLLQSFADLQELVDYSGMVGKTAVLGEQVSIDYVLDIPSGVYLEFENNARITVLPGGSITGLMVYGMPNHVIVDGDLSGVSCINKVVNPIWFNESVDLHPDTTSVAPNATLIDDDGLVTAKGDFKEAVWIGTLAGTRFMLIIDNGELKIQRWVANALVGTMVLMGVEE